MNVKGVKRAAIYARISKSDALVDKVENQVAEMRELAALNNYEVVAVHTDDDVSAYRGLSHRNGYVGLIDGLKAKSYDVVLATEPQRLTRGSIDDLTVLQAHCVKAGAVIHTRSAGIQDPATPTTKALMQIMDVISGLEVETKIERQRARNAADLSKGIPTKGVRSFGWEVDRMTIRESEAEYIRDAYARILEHGQTVWAIAQYWNSIGIKTDAMKKARKSRASGKLEVPAGIWTTTTVRQLLKRPSNAGILTSHGEELPVSKIDPIVSREQYAALLAAIKGEPAPKGPKPKYLLGGIMKCPCGARMNASKSNTSRRGRPKHEYQIYRCRLYGFDKSQQHATIQMHIAESATREWVVVDIGLGINATKIELPDAVAPLKQRIGTLREQKARAQDALIYDGIDIPRLKGEIRTLQGEIELAEAKYAEIISGLSHSTALSDFRSAIAQLDDLAPDEEINFELEKGFAAWDALDIDQRRNILRGSYDIEVQLGGRGAERMVFRRISD